MEPEQVAMFSLTPFLVDIQQPGGRRADAPSKRGSGFICHPEGYVLTCCHVTNPFSGKGRAPVTFGGQDYKASIEKLPGT